MGIARRLSAEEGWNITFLVDHRYLNALTIGDAYPIPRMDKCIDSLGEAEIFQLWTETLVIGKSRLGKRQK